MAPQRRQHLVHACKDLAGKGLNTYAPTVNWEKGWPDAFVKKSPNPFFWPNQCITFPVEKICPKIRTTFVIFTELPEVNYFPLGENAPNLATLPQEPNFYFFCFIIEYHILRQKCILPTYVNVIDPCRISISYDNFLPMEWL
jgi:hypothetical protein